MIRLSASHCGSSRLVISLAIAILCTVSMIGCSNRREEGVPSSRKTVATATHGPAYSIVLPKGEPPVPTGPNRDQFETYCLDCHSPRIVINQPRLPEKKWGDVVHKMVTAYGASLEPDDEKDVVVYLNSIRGLKPDPRQVR